MNNIIDSHNVTLFTIASLLDNAGMDFEIYDDQMLYVTGLSFNFWVRIDDTHHYLIFWTYRDCQPDTGEVDRLRFVNDCNAEFVMIQFSYDTELSRFKGHYVLPLKDGLIGRQVMRIGSLFSGVFDEAVDVGIMQGLLVPYGYRGEAGDEVAVVVEAVGVTKH